MGIGASPQAASHTGGAGAGRIRAGGEASRPAAAAPLHQTERRGKRACPALGALLHPALLLQQHARALGCRPSFSRVWAPVMRLSGFCGIPVASVAGSLSLVACGAYLYPSPPPSRSISRHSSWQKRRRRAPHSPPRPPSLPPKKRRTLWRELRPPGSPAPPWERLPTGVRRTSALLPRTPTLPWRAAALCPCRHCSALTATAGKAFPLAPTHVGLRWGLSDRPQAAMKQGSPCLVSLCCVTRAMRYVLPLASRIGPTQPCGLPQRQRFRAARAAARQAEAGSAAA